MIVLPSFDPNANPSGYIATYLPNKGTLVIKNLSIANLLITFSGSGRTEYLAAFEGNVYSIDFLDQSITYTVQSTINLAQSPISQVTAIAYQQSERVPGTYPIFYAYLTGIGNSLSIASSGTMHFIDPPSVLNGGSPVALIAGTVYNLLAATLAGAGVPSSATGILLEIAWQPSSVTTPPGYVGAWKGVSSGNITKYPNQLQIPGLSVASYNVQTLSVPISSTLGSVGIEANANGNILLTIDGYYT